MRGITRLLVLALAILQPLTAAAQFTPINQAKQQASIQDDQALTSALAEISSKGASARRKMQVLFDDARSKRVGVAATGRKIDTVIGNLKNELNIIVADYAKKNPGGAGNRTVYAAAQDVLNGLRNQASEVLDQIGFDKAADPRALSGDYLNYQQDIIGKVDKAIVQADERLQATGRRQSVTEDLKSIVTKTQQLIDASTVAFLANRTNVLPSAIERIKKEQLDRLSAEMASRFKAAGERSNDKRLDLTEEEAAAIEKEMRELKGAAERSVQTIEGIMRQVSGAKLPTSAPGQAGVNPYLEAKFQAQKQIRDIIRSTRERISKSKERFGRQPGIGQNARDVFNQEIGELETHYNDTVKEFNSFFYAGDPTRKQYNREKEKLKDEAEGCDSFFCDIGRVVSGVGSAIIGKATGGVINLAPQTFSSGLFGISDGKASAYRGAFSNSLSYGGYGGTPYNGGFFGGSAVGGFDPRCYGLNDKMSKSGVALAPTLLIETVYAQDASDESKDLKIQPSTNIDSGETTNVQYGRLPTEPKKSSSIFGNVSNTLKGLFTNNTGNVSQGINNQLGQYISGVFNSSVQRRTGLPCPTGSFGGGLCVVAPCNIPGYRSPYGGLPIGQTLGYQNNDLSLSRDLTANNYATSLAQGLGFLVSSGVSQADAANYAQAIKILQNNALNLQQKVMQVTPILQKTQFFSLTNSAGSDQFANLFYALCSHSISGGSNMIAFCKSKLAPANVALDLTRATSGSTSSSLSAILQSESSFISFATETLNFSIRQRICQSTNNDNSKEINAIKARVAQMKEQIAARQDAVMLQRLNALQALIAQYDQVCATNNNNPSPDAATILAQRVGELEIKADILLSSGCPLAIEKSYALESSRLASNLLRQALGINDATLSDRLRQLIESFNLCAKDSSVLSRAQQAPSTVANQAPGNDIGGSTASNVGALDISVSDNDTYQVTIQDLTADDVFNRGHTELSKVENGIAQTKYRLDQIGPAAISRGPAIRVKLLAGHYKITFRINLHPLGASGQRPTFRVYQFAVAGNSTCRINVDNTNSIPAVNATSNCAAFGELNI